MTVYNFTMFFVLEATEAKVKVGLSTESFAVFHCDECGDEGSEKRTALGVAVCR